MSSNIIPSQPLPPPAPSTHPPASKPSVTHPNRPPPTQPHTLTHQPPPKWDERRLIHTVDYDRGERTVKVRVSGVGRDAIPARYRLRVDGTRFQKDWTVSEVVDRVMRLQRWEDIDGVLNSWIGRFARKNFPLLIRVIVCSREIVNLFRLNST